MSKKSSIIINLKDDIVIKKVLKWPDITFNREIFWLKKFKDSERFPHILDFNEKKYEIKMTYCGEQISKKNCPYDWDKQIKTILRELNKYKCNHNDIKEKEILVYENKIKLVDFGWATRYDEKIPDNWPINLGIDNRIDIHNFNDGYALMQSIYNIIK